MEDRYSVVPVTGVRIDLIQVLKEKRNRPKYLGELADLHKLLSQHAYLDLFSIHETGHVVYFEKAGVTFDYVGPLINYFPATAEKAEDFLGQWAAIWPTGLLEPDGVHDDEQRRQNWLLELGKGFAAGRVCSLRLTTTDYAGDTNDRKRFGEVYNAEYNDGVDRSAEIECAWLKAQVEIHNELNNREFEQKVRTRMLEVKQKLYFPAVP